MCGILAITFSRKSKVELRERVRCLVKKIRHRGPDWSGIEEFDWLEHGRSCLAHERLSIVDPLKGKQPLFGTSKHVMCICNGEIYNHQMLKENLLKEESLSTNSDCQVIAPLYEKYGVSFVSKLDGVFAIVLVDDINKKVFAARDPIGVCPLYMGSASDGSVAFASEMKALDGYCDNVELFLPGHYFMQAAGEKAVYEKYFDPTWMSQRHPVPRNHHIDFTSIKEGLTKAVRKRLMGDVSIGFLISGGLDSSLVASIAKKEMEKIPNCKNIKLQSFSVGIEGSQDIVAARMAAQHIGTEHHELVYTVQEGIDALEDVIYHMETYDPVTIRGSVALYLLSRFVKSKGIKVVLAGEGADEMFGGYLYFHKAPNPSALHRECQLKVSELHLFDIVRTNRCGPAWGVEIRVPFLDLEFLECVMSLDPKYKMCSKERMEKWVLRSAFSDENYLPESILWRQKEGFSDGVGYNWTKSLQQHAEQMVSDDNFFNAKSLFPINTPKTKEAFLYRTIFEKHFKVPGANETISLIEFSVAGSSATAFEWDESFKKNVDQSGRAISDIHRCPTKFMERSSL